MLQRADARRNVARLRRFDQLLNFGNQFVRFPPFLQSPRSGDGTDATDTFGDGFFGRDTTQAHLTGVGQVRPAAQFHAEIAHRDHTHFVGILLAKQRHRAAGFGF